MNIVCKLFNILNLTQFLLIRLQLDVWIFILINGWQYLYKIKDFINLLEQASC